jgi:hypothetical protein
MHILSNRVLTYRLNFVRNNIITKIHFILNFGAYWFSKTLILLVTCFHEIVIFVYFT